MSTKTKHTPGPWKTNGDFVVTADGQRNIARAAGDTDDEAEANARLIAAAPELAAALENLQLVATTTTADLVGFNGATELDSAIDAARTALTKATGQNPNLKNV